MMNMMKIASGLLAVALSSLSVATIQIHAPFAIGETWKATTYAGHTGQGPFYAADFNRADDQTATVRATHDGVAIPRSNSSYGNFVDLYGLDNRLMTRVAHLKNPHILSGPTRVSAGQLIGNCGATGNVYPPGTTHIHLEVYWNGVRQRLSQVAGAVTLDGQWVFSSEGSYQGNNITSKIGEWDWHTLPGETWQPLATSDTNGLLYFMHTGKSSTNGIYYSSMDGNGIPPSNWNQLPGATALGLAMTHLGATRYIAHRSLTNDHKIYFGALNGASFGGWSWTGETSSHAPALCEVNGEIYLLHKGDNEDQRMLLHAWKAGQGWRAHEVLPGLTAHSPALAKFKGQLWAAHRGVNANGAIFVANRGGDQIWRPMGGNSPIPPSMFEWEGRLYLAYRGNSNNFIYLHSTSGNNDWRLDVIYIDATAATPGLFTFYGRLYLTRILPGGVMAFKRIG